MENPAGAFCDLRSFIELDERVHDWKEQVVGAQDFHVNDVEHVEHKLGVADGSGADGSTWYCEKSSPFGRTRRLICGEFVMVVNGGFRNDG